MSAFEDVAAAAAPELGALALRTLATRVAADWPEHALLAGMGDGFGEQVRPILRAQHHDGLAPEEAARFLRGLAAGYAERASTVSVETVWSGPSSHSVPVREMAQALVDVIDGAQRELLLMTYSAKPHRTINQALSAAVARGVGVSVVVETLHGAGSALTGAEPAAAFAGVAGVRLWHWPVTNRAERGSRMHAKLAVADRRVLLTSSANLTQSGVSKNVEAGLLVRGGTAPQRAAEHIAELQSNEIFEPLPISRQGAS